MEGESEVEGSEVTRLLEQITQEYEAGRRGMYGHAITSSHAFITARMENIEKAHEALSALIGQQEAFKLMFKSIEQSNL